MSVPCSPKDKLEGILWLPRMLDKARKHGEGTLHEDYHPNLGKGHDERCCKFLKVRYADVVEQIDQGLTNSEMVDWCFENGRRPDEFDIEMWNAYISKLGTMDENQGFAEYVQKRKDAYGISNRDDIVTFFHLIEKDEGRLD
ncbi:DUF5069 domain-containing protein [bacterium]|jgi:hypothetical protein|nr:DUF5069 domain-containing protein [Gemmatimonadota bacterium]MCH2663740.1 DUF5069 domain-containing protein [bacterium]HCK10981.1 DUF5069 domain-containing protein [Candidatus Latescibacterota bacterium]